LPEQARELIVRLVPTIAGPVWEIGPANSANKPEYLTMEANIMLYQVRFYNRPFKNDSLKHFWPIVGTRQEAESKAREWCIKEGLYAIIFEGKIESTLYYLLRGAIQTEECGRRY
jgi:hypothetical protein